MIGVAGGGGGQTYIILLRVLVWSRWDILVEFGRRWVVGLLVSIVYKSAVMCRFLRDVQTSNICGTVHVSG